MQKQEFAKNVAQTMVHSGLPKPDLNLLFEAMRTPPTPAAAVERWRANC